MTNAPDPVAVEQEVRNQDVPRWLRLFQDWKAFAWPAVAALLAAILHFFGRAAENGKTAALGIYHLDRPAISEGYILFGAAILAALGLQVILVVIIATGLRAHARWIIRALPDAQQVRLGVIFKRGAWGWLVVIAAIATAACGGLIAADLVRDADAMILKPANEVGTAWMRMTLDQDQFWEIGYQLVLATIITVFAALSWWILTRFARSTAARAVYGTWAVIQLFILMAAYAFIFGAATTFQPYPIVAFSNMAQLCGKDALPVLIGSDDKVYAFLVLFNVGSANERPGTKKVILYLPRTEVKWMTVLEEQPLHIIAHYHDLKPYLPRAPIDPEPKPDSSGSGSPKSSAPPPAPEKSTPPR